MRPYEAVMADPDPSETAQAVPEESADFDRDRSPGETIGPDQKRLDKNLFFILVENLFRHAALATVFAYCGHNEVIGNSGNQSGQFVGRVDV